QARVYLTPPGAEAHRALERIFASQASGAIEQDGLLHVNGRDIPFLKRAESILWFEFAALCEGPRAVADYIALAKAGPAIIIANVPQFTIYSEDAAKRFVQLVDEFYDRRVKLVLSAAAPITELYDGERLRVAVRPLNIHLSLKQSISLLKGWLIQSARLGRSGVLGGSRHGGNRQIPARPTCLDIAIDQGRGHGQQTGAVRRPPAHPDVP